MYYKEERLINNEAVVETSEAKADIPMVDEELVAVVLVVVWVVVELVVSVVALVVQVVLSQSCVVAWVEVIKLQSHS